MNQGLPLRLMPVALLLLGTGWWVAVLADDARMAELEQVVEQVEALVTVDNHQARVLGQEVLDDVSAMDPELHIRLLYALAGASWRTREYDDAREFAGQMLELAERQQMHDEQGKALRTLGNVAYFEGRFEDAEGLYLAARSAHHEAGNPDATARVLANLGSLMSNMGEYRKALEYLEQALEINTRMDDATGLFGAWLNMGNAQYRQGLLAKAMESYLNATRYAEDIDDRRRLGMVYTNVGLIYSSLGDHEQAREAWHKAFDLHAQYEETSRAAATLGNLATIMRQEGDYEQALDLHRQALDLAQQAGSRRTIAFNLRELGDIQRLLGNHELAREKLEEAMRLFTDMDAAVDMMVTRMRLAMVDVDTGHSALALSTLKDAVRGLVEQDAKSHAVSAQEALVQAYRAMGNHEAALDAFEQFKRMSDELAEEQRRGRLDVLRTQFELEQREQQIKALSREQQIGELRMEQQELRIKTQRLLWYGSLVGIFVLGVTLLLLWRGYRIKQRLARQLREISITDPLTGAFNRRYALDVGHREMQRAIRHDVDVAVCMLDLDHFKQINDTYGHAAGDKVIKTLVERCKSELRETDMFVRWGGEEFMILLSRSDRQGAAMVAERLRLAVNQQPFTVGDAHNPVMLTISIGVSVRDGREIAISDFIEEADSALYKAKEDGRDCVRIHRGGQTQFARTKAI